MAGEGGGGKGAERVVSLRSCRYSVRCVCVCFTVLAQRWIFFGGTRSDTGESARKGELHTYIYNIYIDIYIYLV